MPTRYVRIESEYREEFFRFIAACCVEELDIPYEMRHIKLEDVIAWTTYIGWARDEQYERYGKLCRSGVITEEVRKELLETREFMDKKVFMSCMHERYGARRSRIKGQPLFGSFFFGVATKVSGDGEYVQKLRDVGLYEYDHKCRVMRKQLTDMLNKWGGNKGYTNEEICNARAELDYDHRMALGPLWRTFPI